MTPRVVRLELESRLGFASDELEPRKKEIAEGIRKALEHMESEKSESTPIAAAAAPSFAALAAPASRSAEAQRSLNASKKRALTAAAGDGADDDEFDEERPSSKRQAAAGGAIASSSSSGGSGGDSATSVVIGPSRRVEVRKFKGTLYVDIRETYTDKTSGEERPGKKGTTHTHTNREQRARRMHTLIDSTRLALLFHCAASLCAGISLRAEQWEALLANASKINAMVARMG